MVECRYCDLEFYDNQDRADHERDVHTEHFQPNIAQESN